MEAVVRDLSSQGLFILEIGEGPRGTAAKGTKLSQKVLIDFTQTLGLFLSNGLSLKEAFHVAKDVYQKSPQRTLFLQVSEALQKGQSLHQGLQPWRNSFPHLYLGLVKIGEKTGDLAGVLGRLTQYLTSRKELSDKTKGALVYPILVVAVAIGGLALLTIFVLPALSEILGGLNPESSASYRTNIQGFQAGLGWTLGLLGASVMGAFVLERWAEHDPGVKRRLDQAAWRTPGWGKYLKTRFSLDYAFAMEALLGAGYPLEEALKEGAEVTTNLWLRDQLDGVRDQVIRGRPLAEAFRETQAFPETLTGWITVGEKAHDLGKSFAQLRLYYQHELDQYHTTFLNLIEPLLILVVGGLLVLLIVTLITPVFSMMGNLL